MTRALSISLLLLAAGPMTGIVAEIIDRIAVSVGNQAITTSDIEREVRVTAFFNRVKPDFGPVNRRATADRMVEQRLILRELQNSHYPGPAPSEIDPTMDKFVRDNFADVDEYRRALADAGITDRELRDEVLWQRRLLGFIDVRFRSNTQAGEKDIQDFFHKYVEPLAQVARPGQAVTVGDYRAQIAQKIVEREVDKQMNDWLESVRQRSAVVYHQEAFQ